jgi:hypothetical protein
MQLRHILSEVGDWPTVFGGQMFFVRLLSLLIAIAAIVGLFVEIPIVSNFAFWLMVVAYLLWIGHSNKGADRIKLQLMLTIVLTGAAIVGVFVAIPIVSDYVFWVMTGAYLIIVASTDIYRSGE